MKNNIWLIGQLSCSFANLKEDRIMEFDNKSRILRPQKGESDYNQFLDGIKGTLFFQMHRINLIMFRLANKHLNAADIPIKSEQIPVLLCIYKSKTISQQEIANMIQRDKSSIQRTVSILQKRGLVTIQSDKEDKRKNILKMTKLGIKVALKIGKIVIAVESEIMEVFDAEESFNNIQSLKKIANNLENLHQVKC